MKAKRRRMLAVVIIIIAFIALSLIVVNILKQDIFNLQLD